MTPKVLPVLPDNIPKELKAIDRWLVWRLDKHVKADGSVVWKKVPRQVDGRLAQTTNPKHWATYEEALDAYLMGGFEGIGFVFDGTDDVHGIDMDDCLTDGQLSHKAKELLDKVDGYAEISPSGTGIKLFTQSNLAINGNKGGVEVYRDGRYFTVTGHKLNGHGALPRSVQDIDWFVEKHFGSNEVVSGLELYKPPLPDWDLDRVEAELLPHVGDIEGYDAWLQLGMALHHQGQGDEAWMELWDQASQSTGSYNRREIEAKWDSFSEQRDRGNGAVTLASVIKKVIENKKGLQTDLFDTFKALIENAADLTELKEKVVEAIKSESALDHINRSVLAQILRTKFKDFGFPIDLKDAKNLIRPKVNQGAPEWLDGWVYVTHIDKFFNVVTKRTVSQSGFGAMFNRYTGDDSAAVLALDLWRIDTPDKAIYLPWADTFFDLNGSPCVNTYNPNSPPDIPAKYSKGDLLAIEAVENHLKLILTEPGSVDIMLDWLAHNVQFPGRKIRWAPLIKGIEGDGKSLLGNLLMATMGHENVGIVSPTVLAGSFTKWASGRCVNVLEEIRMVGHNRHDVLNTIKPYISNDHITIHPKGTDEYVAPNTVNYIAFTNHVDALPLEDTDRRWWVQFTPFVDVADLAAVTGDGYFTRLFEYIANNGPGLRKWLLERQISDTFHANGRAPASAAKAQMVSLNKSDEVDAIKDLIEEGGPGFCSEVLSSSCLTAALQMVDGIEPPKNAGMHKMLMKLGFSPLEKKLRWNGSTHRVWTRRSDLKKLEGDELIAKVREKLDETIKNELLG